jgi:murein DD-endopeptidase MepM/ murein hydrolase activator NlpD
MIARIVIVILTVLGATTVIVPRSTPEPSQTTPANMCVLRERVEIIPNTMVWPVSPTEITSPFGDRPELPFGFHYGLDFGTGWSDPIPAVIGGTVIFAGWSYGNEIRIQNGQYTYLYAHLSKIDVVVGQEVAMGEIIGLSGSTGLSLGPHLHLEIWDNGVPIDPYPILVAQTEVKKNVTEEVVC